METTVNAVPSNVEDDKSKGLYGKYRVERIDGKERGPYFVLDYAHDPHAIPALLAYADSCKAEYPELARDLRALAQRASR
jgi:folylpolyglutamate synthase/dihydropteroate synthase